MLLVPQAPTEGAFPSAFRGKTHVVRKGVRWVALGFWPFLAKLSLQGRIQQDGEEGKVFDLFANRGNERKKGSFMSRSKEARGQAP